MMSRFGAAGLLAGMIALSGCQSYDPVSRPYVGDWYGPRPYLDGYSYKGRDFAHDAGVGEPNLFRGPGARVLDPWLAYTPEGRDVVLRGFRDQRGWISAETAHRANVWFRRYADTDRDLALTDPEIRVALAQAALNARY